MKTTIAALAAVLIAAPAFAASKPNQPNADVTLDIAFEPESGFGTTFGPTFGGGVDIGHDIQARGELSYFNWSRDMEGFELTYRRIPIAGGIRKYFTVDKAPIRPFAQGMFALSFDEVEASILGQKISDSKVRPGVTIAGGAEAALNNNLGLHAILKYHLEADGFLSLGFGAIYRF